MSESAIGGATVAWRVAFFTLGIAVVGLALTPRLQLPGLGMPVGTDDLLQHFLAFAALGIAGGFAWRAPRAVVAGLIAFAALLELAQFLSPGREVHFDDALAGIAGAAAGTAFVAGLRMLRGGDHAR